MSVLYVDVCQAYKTSLRRPAHHAHAHKEAYMICVLFVCVCVCVFFFARYRVLHVIGDRETSCPNWRLEFCWLCAQLIIQ